MMEKRKLQTSVRRTPLFSLITTCSILTTSLAEQSISLFDSQFEGSNCTNTTPIIQTSSKLQCATLCGQLNGCVGFFHKKDTFSCSLIDPTSSSVCTINNTLEWKSWKKSSGQSEVTNVSTSTASTTDNLTTTEQTTTLTTTTEKTTTPTTTEQTTTSTNTEQTTTPTTTEQTTTPTTTEQTTTPTTTEQTTTPATTEQTTTPTTTEQTTTPTTTEQTTTPTTTGQTTTPTTTEQTTTPTTTEQTTTPTTTEQTTIPTTTEQTTTPTTTTEQTTTPITTTAQPLCPITLPMETYASTTLSDNTQFTFLFGQSGQGANQANALSNCPNNHNGTLVQILTAPKMDFLMDCLDKTFEGKDYRFWMDAIYDGGLWKTSDGKDVLSDPIYWQNGFMSGTKPCAVLDGVLYDYKMREIGCGTPRLLLCEKTN